MKKAYYQAGMNDCEYCISFSIHHPTLLAMEISDCLETEADHFHNVGEQRKTPAGTLLEGTWDSTYWSKEIECFDDSDPGTMLGKTALQYKKHHAALRRIKETNGEISLFVDLFANGLCDFIVPSDSLALLGELGIDVRLDYYSNGQSES